MIEALTQVLQTKLFWVTAFVALIWTYFKFVIYNYWQRRGIPYDEPIVPFGCTLPLFLGKLSIGERLISILSLNNFFQDVAKKKLQEM